MQTKNLIPPAFVLLWATGFIGARYAMPWAEPFTFLAVRFGLAFLILAAIALMVGAARMTRREILSSILAGILMHGVYLGGVFWAVHDGLTAGLSALIVGLQPLITRSSSEPAASSMTSLRRVTEARSAGKPFGTRRFQTASIALPLNF